MSAQMQVYKVGRENRGSSGLVVSALMADLRCVCTKLRLHHYPAGYGGMDFHTDNEAADADKHIRFSLLYFADDDMQSYIRTPGVCLPTQPHSQLNLLPVCLASSIAHVPGFVSSLSQHEREQRAAEQATERAAENKKKKRERYSTPESQANQRLSDAKPERQRKKKSVSQRLNILRNEDCVTKICATKKRDNGTWCRSAMHDRRHCYSKLSCACGGSNDGRLAIVHDCL